MGISWTNIRPLGNSLTDGFEELICQLARNEKITNCYKFIRKGKPDAGIECYWILNDNSEIAWQAKFFTQSLETTQWAQIDKSVKTAIEKHPNLRKYIIVIPIDPPDARINKKDSMQQKWKNRIEKWKGWAKSKNMSIDFEPWWSSDIISRLQKPENEGLTYFWFNKDEFTTSWFKEQNDLAIADLGKRYTPELNVKLEIAQIFSGCNRDDTFTKKLQNILDEYITSGNKIIRGGIDVTEFIPQLTAKLRYLQNLFENINIKGTERIPIIEILNILNAISNISTEVLNHYRNKVEETKEENKESKDDKTYDSYRYRIDEVYKFNSINYRLTNYFNSISVALANFPYLILEGEAGIGKSHLLADIIIDRNKEELLSLFFLGQHFVTEEDPWIQIFNKNNIRCSVDTFLGALNSKAQIKGNRIIIFIDAVNEGKGKYFWNKYINSFLLKIKKYEWLGVVLSIRSSYTDLIFPIDVLPKNKILRLYHYGFRNREYEAAKLFFKNYNIELPSIPLLHPEFDNPLFLKLFCEGLAKSGYSKIPEGFQGITTIIDFFINSINSNLSKPDRLNYPRSINIVRKVIDMLITHKINNNLRYINYEEAYKIIDAISKEFNLQGILLEELISEGILSKNLFWTSDKKHEEGIYIVYERFEDHLAASQIITSEIDLNILFKKGGKLFELFKTEKDCYLNKGLLEALTIQIPEKVNIEIYEFLTHLRNSYPIIECFVISLLWRKTNTISNKLVGYINSIVLSYEGTFNLFWNTILSVTSNPEHYFNAHYLNSTLSQYSLATRDSWWNKYLKEQYDDESAIKRLIDWSWSTNDKTHISDKSIELTSITLAWFLSSTNRKLRDTATKALISLLENRISVLLNLMKLFKNVNDPYIYERLFAVAYGCTLRTEQTDLLPILSNYIYMTIFSDRNQIYPHILLRDYARGVIEYTVYLGYKIEFDISKVRPPYKSKWPANISTLSHLKRKYDKKKYSYLWQSIMGFGDFARYTIGTNNNLSNWSNLKKGEKRIDRKKIFETFKNKLNTNQKNLLTELDPFIKEKQIQRQKNDISGILLEFISGRKSNAEIETSIRYFKESLSKELLYKYENDIEPFMDHNMKFNDSARFDLRIAQRLIFSSVIKLGWKPELHLHFDKEIGTGRGRYTIPHERIGKKYQWISYYEYMARLSDNYIKYSDQSFWDQIIEEYQGPWEPYVRDIDPTLLIKKKGNLNNGTSKVNWWFKEEYSNWNLDCNSWLRVYDDLPSISKTINLVDSNKEEWLVLESYPEWEEPKKFGEEKWEYPTKLLWYQIRSYLIKENDYLSFNKWAKQQDFSGRWTPESHSRYEVFSREYFWSPAFKFFENEYYGGQENVYIKDRINEKMRFNVILTTKDYLWEEEFDNSKDETINYFKPSNFIYQQMQLKPGYDEGNYINIQGEVVCFDPSVSNNTRSCLLVKKEELLKFLVKNHLKIVWIVIGEKNVLGDHTSNKEIYRLEISGNYFLDKNNVVTGNLLKKNV